MIEEFKRVLLLGLGAAATTKDELKAIIKDLVEKGKLTKEEATEVLCDLSEDSKKEFKEAKEQAKESFQKSVEDVFGKIKFASKEDLNALEKRVKAIETKLKKNA